MYSTCLFCQTQLGKNEAIEHFPVGRRLAFDAAKGRLWVVCRKCERWNLTPLEERWEAIEECERAFRDTKLRVSTEHIGLARVSEGLELVRIGEPQRPEMAAWRYGDQFGRRRRKHIATIAGAVVVVGGVMIAGPAVGLWSGGATNVVFQLANAGASIYRKRKMVLLGSAEHGTFHARLSDLPNVRVYASEEGIELTVPVLKKSKFVSFEVSKDVNNIRLRGEDAVRAVGSILPVLNRGGGSAAEVTRAVDYLEQSGSPDQLFRRAVAAIEKRDADRLFKTANMNKLQSLPTPGRLALEMAVHEESERRALEGELHVLEEAWKEAEEIAGISDDMFLPASVDEELERLKRGEQR